VKAELGNISVGEVAKELGRRWAEMDKSQKEKYEVASAEAKAKYLVVKENYQPSQQFLEMKKAPKMKFIKDPSAPKRPQTSFLLFSGEERPKVKEELGNISVGEVAKELGRRWAEMDKTQKEKYEVASAEAKAKYLVDKENYQPSQLFLEKKAEQVKKQEKKVVGGEMGKYFNFVEKNWMKVAEENKEMKANEVQEMIWKTWNKDNMVDAAKQKKVRDPAEPKKPLSAFSLFQKHMKMELVKKGVTLTSSSKEFKDMMSERWSSLEEAALWEAEKKRFIDQAGELKVKYMKENDEFRRKNNED